MKESIIQPIIEDLKKVHAPKPAPAQEAPPLPAELDQDAGGGYNPDHTISQS